MSVDIDRVNALMESKSIMLWQAVKAAKKEKQSLREFLREAVLAWRFAKVA